MPENKTLLVGCPSTSTITGLSIQFDSLLAGFRERGLPFELIDRSRIDAEAIGSSEIRRTLKTIKLVCEYYLKLPNSRHVYFTLGSSRAGFLRDLLMLEPARLLGKRAVVHLHGGGYKDFFSSQPALLRKLISGTLSRVDRIIVEGELLRDQFWFVSNPQERIVVAPNGVPPPQNPHTARYIDPTEPVRIIYLSNMLESKGYIDVLAACHLVKNRLRRPFICDFCGAFIEARYDTYTGTANEAMSAFKNRIVEWDLQNEICFHGTVKGKQKDDLLRNAHVFVLPTYYPGEGQPVSIIEAMSHGVPIVTTRYRGIPELVIDGENGIFVEPRSPEQIADAIESIVGTPESFAHFSESSRTLFSERFTEEQHVKSVISHIIGF